MYRLKDFLVFRPGNVEASKKNLFSAYGFQFDDRLDIMGEAKRRMRYASKENEGTKEKQD